MCPEFSMFVFYKKNCCHFFFFERKLEINDTLLLTPCSCRNSNIISRKTFAAGLVPSDWKIADIVPIFKKGAKDDPTNYRPVSLTSELYKVMESLIKDSLKTFLDKKEAISNYQHGFTMAGPVLRIFWNLLKAGHKHSMKVSALTSSIWTTGRHSIVFHTSDSWRS